MQVTRPTFLPLLAPVEPERATEGAVRDEYCGDLSIMYSFGPPFGKRIVTHADLQRMELNRRVLHRTALDHLEALASRAQFHGQPPALMLSFEGLESSLLLAEAFWARIRAAVPGEIVVGVPARDVVIVTGSQSGPGLEKARRAVDRVFFAGDNNLLTRRLLVRRGGAWEPFDGAPRRHVGRPVPHPGDQRPRQYQEHPSWPQQRVPVSSMRPISPIDRMGPRPVPGPRPMPTGPAPAGPTPVGPAPLAPAAGLGAHRAVPHQPARGYEPYPADAAPRSAVPYGPMAKPTYGGDDRRAPAQPTSSVPYSSVPYSSVPYSATPYSATPYSATPYSAQPYSPPPSRPYSPAPYSARPYSAPPASPPPYSAPPAQTYAAQSAQPYPAPPAASAPPYSDPDRSPAPVYPASWGASPDAAPVRPGWDGRTGARARFSR
ncbi:MAG: hypothetical protein ACM30G_10320 [Micromonosporaceae bacterium]